MWTEVPQPSQRMRTGLALPSGGKRGLKTSLRVEGLVVVGALAELRGQTSSRCSETILLRRQKGGLEAGGTCWSNHCH